MATGDKYTNVYSKKFLSWQEFSTYIIGYLRKLTQDVMDWIWPGDNSWLADSVTLGSDVNDEIDVGAFNAIDNGGNVIKQSTPRSGYEKDVPFENTTAIDYHIGVHQFEVPDEAEVAARSGQPEYRYFREDIGEVAHPDGVTDNGDGTITLVVNSVTEARDNTNRYVYVWLVDPLSAVDWIEEKQIVWNSGASENRITTTAKLGQTTISTDVNDYWVALRGVSVKRDTDLRTDKSYVYIGKATGNSGGVPTFSTADQKVVGDFVQEVIEARGSKATLDARLDVELTEDGDLRRSRTATLNQGDTPAPGIYGGGTIWAEFRTTGTTEIILDDSIDWRDRFITINGYGAEVATSILPGQAGDNSLRAVTDAEATTTDTVLFNSIIVFLYTEAGGSGVGNPQASILVEGHSQTGYLYAKSADGNLAFKFLIAPTNECDIVLEISYSPKQNHY